MRLRPPAIRRRPAVRPTSSPTPATDRPAPVAAAPQTAPGSSRRRSAIIVAGLFVLATLVAAALLLTMPTIEEAGPEGVTRDATPELQLRIARPMGVSADSVSATIDGDPVAADRIRVLEEGALVEVRAPRLEDGRHEVRVSIAGVGVLQRTLRASWTVTVDTAPPDARFVAPVDARDAANPYAAAGVAVVTKLPLDIELATEPGASVRLASSRGGVDAIELDAGDEPRRTAKLQLPQGMQLVVATVRDEAGNITERTRRVLVDTAGPAMTVRMPRLVRDATLSVPIAARDPHGVSLQVKVNGNVVEDALQQVEATAPPNAPAQPADEAPADDDDEQAGEDDADDATEPLPVAGRWKLVLDEPAYEGRHAIEVVATDALGTSRTLTRTIIVDSGERLGDVSGLRTGARGRDVLELHDALVKAGVATRDQLASDASARSYGAPTRAAVQRFQSQRGMDADGIAGPETVAGLTLKIVIDRAANTLTLYRLGEAVNTWGVATGSAEYPTPAGEFEIQSKQKDPTWTPPDSDWAKDAEPIAPGPDNPLGTRWMAIAGTVGIHGTNNPASIGYSVSHGCIRMRIPDVEALFEMVPIGTPVTVV